MQLQQIFHNVRWFGFHDYQNCFPIFAGSFAFPEVCNLSGYLVKIWVDAIRDKPTNFKALEIDSDDWAYRYRARFVIECDGKQITDQRGIDNMLSIGDVINSAYRWMANNGLQRKHGARHPNLLLWGNAEFESHEEYVLRNASNAGGKASEI